ncbi:MAG: hypothetical protein ABI772_05710 [Bacteroidota bacterium]
MKNRIPELLYKLLLIGAPLILLFIYYVIKDPFKVLYTYKNYYEKESQYVYFNKDLITTETLIKQNPENHYDSYIFGNSRSYFFRVNEWKKYTGSEHIYHFNANDESLYGIYKKMIFLDENNYDLKNALFILDSKLLSMDEPNKGHIFIKHRVYTGQSWFDYQSEFLAAFFNPLFLTAYLDLQFTGKFKSYMKKVMSDKVYRWDAKHNEMFLDEEEMRITSDSTSYYNLKKKIFYERPTSEIESQEVLKDKNIFMLKKIKTILTKHRTEYRIIISPLYDQLRINHNDFNKLVTVFGKEYVYDFSGKNIYTDNPGNYYEISHYRPLITKELLRITYEK